jgi:hypothetical protein
MLRLRQKQAGDNGAEWGILPRWFLIFNIIRSYIMEHSKLPFRHVSDNSTEITYWDIEDADHRKIGDTGKSQANADFIVTACNQHNTLKAKEGLFDELVHGTLIAKYFCEQHLYIGPNPPAVNALLYLNSTLSKAKELNK